jgi:hypothetical protein
MMEEYGSGLVNVLTDPDADPGGSKTYYRSGSVTLKFTILLEF